MHPWRAEPPHRVRERLLHVRQRRRHVLHCLLVHAPDVAVLVRIGVAIEREQHDALGPHAFAALSGHRRDALAVIDEIEQPPAAAPILPEAAIHDRRDPHLVVLVRAGSDALRAVGHETAFRPREQCGESRAVAMRREKLAVQLAVRHR